MNIPLFQIDAFTGRVFAGNPAAVCPLPGWIDESLMQAIAAENNLSETAFFVKKNSFFELRWFTPATEVDLCGHATLASAFVIMKFIEPRLTEVAFETKSGTLTVTRSGDRLTMNFPAKPPAPCTAPDDLVAGLGRTPQAVLGSDDYLAVFATEDEVRALAPDFTALSRLNLRGVIVTAPGRGADFVSRFFAPGVGINEDPVTGSAHCILIPYWSARLDRTRLHALQVSKRGGELFCELKGDRVLIAGECAFYLRGEIVVP